MNEIKYKIIFLRKEYSTLNVIAVLKLKSLTNVVRFRNKTYQIEIANPAFSQKNEKVYLFDFDTGTQMKFTESNALLNPSELDSIVSTHVIKELMATATIDFKEKVINMVLGAIIGALLAVVLMFFYMNNKIDEIYKSFTVTQPIFTALKMLR